jgi:hypothetical protein
VGSIREFGEDEAGAGAFGGLWVDGEGAEGVVVFGGEEEEEAAAGAVEEGGSPAVEEGAGFGVGEALGFEEAEESGFGGCGVEGEGVGEVEGAGAGDFEELGAGLVVLGGDEEGLAHGGRWRGKARLAVSGWWRRRRRWDAEGEFQGIGARVVEGAASAVGEEGLPFELVVAE